MFDIGATELLVIVIVAVLVIGPKDLPLALRTAGRWIGKVRKVSAHFRSGIDAMIREAELEEMEKKWQEQNAQIMRETGASEAMPGSAPAMTPDIGPPMTPLAPPSAATTTATDVNKVDGAGAKQDASAVAAEKPEG